MDKILIFAGTYEGRKLCELLSSKGISPTVCVATDYGKVVLDDIPKINVITGRLSVIEMIKLMATYDVVVDATHPYATVVSGNVMEACEKSGVKHIRLIRKESEHEGVISVSSTENAVELLNIMEGNILLTTGSKELHKYKKIDKFSTRVFARVLPSIEVMSICQDLGLKGRNIIAMQGPFSQIINQVMLQEYDCSIMVTKNTGDVGGFKEKVAAAKLAGAKVIVIERPSFEEGVLLENIMKVLDKVDNFDKKLTKEEIGQSTLKNHLRYFPLFVDSYGRKALVVGGGKIACKRIRKLRDFGFEITVVAPDIAEKIDNVNYVERKFNINDAVGMEVVLAATNNKSVNKLVATTVKELGNWCSVANCKEEGNFIFSSIILEDEMVVAISSDGTSPMKTKAFSSEVRLFLRGDKASEN